MLLFLLIILSLQNPVPKSRDQHWRNTVVMERLWALKTTSCDPPRYEDCRVATHCHPVQVTPPIMGLSFYISLFSLPTCCSRSKIQLKTNDRYDGLFKAVSGWCLPSCGKRAENACNLPARTVPDSCTSLAKSEGNRLGLPACLREPAQKISIFGMALGG